MTENIAVSEKVVLECLAALCDLGESGACYRTLKLGEWFAMEMLKFHLQQNHTGATAT